MKAFHGKQEVRDFYIARVKAHYEADEIIKGKYWEGGKGCAVGCTLHSSNHSHYEKELGIPRIIARLEDGIFEGLPNKEAKEFPLKLLSSIGLGADLSMVFPKFMHWLLVDEEFGVIRYARSNRSKKSLQAVADLYQRKISGDNVGVNEWFAVRKNADADAADAAAHAAYTAYTADDADAAAAHAAYTAAAAYNADAADADTDAAYTAASHATYTTASHAAYTAAYAAAYNADATDDADTAVAHATYTAYHQKSRIRQADKLMELLSDAE